MPTKSKANTGQEEQLLDKVVVVSETCPDLSPFTQEKPCPASSNQHATPDSKTISYDVAQSSPSKTKQSEESQECTSPPFCTRVNDSSKSIAILTTPDRDFIHMLVQKSYNLIDNSNNDTVKQLIEKVKRKESRLVQDHGKEILAAREEVALLKNERDVLRAQLEENKRTIREVKASVTCQVNLHKARHKIEVQKLELKLTNFQKDNSDFVAKRNSASVTHDLKHERNEHRRTKEHLGLLITNKDGIIKDLKGTIKNNNDKIASLENEIKSLNKELRAFGKSIAQEEQKINGRLKLQGNK